MLKKTGFSLLMILAIASIPSKAFAHAIQTNYLLFSELASQSRDNLDTRLEATQQGLEIQSTFSTEEPVQEAEVSVYAPNNPDEPWMVGYTDEEGKFSFIPDTSIEGDWEIAIIQEGHEDYLTIPVGEQGIEFDLISQGNKSDIHYSAIPLNSWGILGFSGLAMSATALLGYRRFLKS